MMDLFSIFFCFVLISYPFIISVCCDTGGVTVTLPSFPTTLVYSDSFPSISSSLSSSWSLSLSPYNVTSLGLCAPPGVVLSNTAALSLASPSSSNITYSPIQQTDANFAYAITPLGQSSNYYQVACISSSSLSCVPSIVSVSSVGAVLATLSTGPALTLTLNKQNYAFITVTSTAIYAKFQNNNLTVSGVEMIFSTPIFSSFTLTLILGSSSLPIPSSSSSSYVGCLSYFSVSRLSPSLSPVCPSGSVVNPLASPALNFSKSVSPCIACTPGYFSPLSSSTATTTCSPCAAGSYSSVSGASSCTSCSSLTFQPMTGQSSCSTCPQGQVSAQGGITCSIPTQVCPLGTIANLATGSCAPCPPGNYAPLPGVSTCTQCQQGYYQVSSGSTSCFACGYGLTNSGPGSASCTVTLCPPGTYLSANTSSCTSCPIGYFAQGQGNSMCTKCPAGSFSAVLGASNCTLCPPSQFSSVDGSTSCTTCSTVPYPRGRYTSVSGSTTCLQCSGVMISDITQTTCTTPSCLYFQEWYALNNRTCSNCTAGQFYNTTAPDPTVCYACPPGTYSPVAGSVCLDCSPGTYSSYPAATMCSECPLGTDIYSTDYGLSTCHYCPNNTYSGQFGIPCSPCPTFTSSSIGATACTVNCGAGVTGYYPDPNTGACEQCPAGSANSYSVSAAFSFLRLPTSVDQWCTPCDPGFYAPTAGYLECLACGPGNETLGTSTLCVPCPQGTFSSNTNNYACSPCPVSTYSPPGSGSCIHCPPGTYAPAGSSSCSAVFYAVGSWGACSSSCGYTSVQTRSLQCYRLNADNTTTALPSSSCAGVPVPITAQYCTGLVPCMSPPAAPSSVSAMTISPSSIALKWTLPPVVSYLNQRGMQVYDPVIGGVKNCSVTEYLPLLGTTITIYNSTAISSININSLAPNTTLSFRIRCSNNGGWGASSALVSATTWLPSPSTVSSASAVPFSSTTMIISWTLSPASTPPVGYEFLFLVSYAFANTTLLTQAAFVINGVNYFVPSLIPNTHYDFYVQVALCLQGVTSYGLPGVLPFVEKSALSVPFPIYNVATPPVAPSQPTPPLLVSSSFSSLSLDWSSAALLYNPPISSWTVNVNGVSYVPTPPSSTSLNISNLFPLSTYNVSLSALNAGGSSPYSSVVSYMTSGAPPATPTSVTFSQVTDSTIECQWSGGIYASTTLGYNVTYSWLNTSVTFASLTVYVTENLLLLTGLTPETLYYFSIVSINSLGSSAPSSSASSSTLPVPPSVILLWASSPSLTATSFGTNSSLTINFDRPTSQPAISTQSDIDSLFAFTQPIGSAYRGLWLSPWSLAITITNAGSASPTIGVLQVLLLPQPSSAPNSVGVRAHGVQTPGLISLPARGLQSPILGGSWRTLSNGPALSPSSTNTFTVVASTPSALLTSVTVNLATSAPVQYYLSLTVLGYGFASLNGFAAASSGSPLSFASTAADLAGPLSKISFQPSGQPGTTVIQLQVLDSTNQFVISTLDLIVNVIAQPVVSSPPVIQAPATVFVGISAFAPVTYIILSTSTTRSSLYLSVPAGVLFLSSSAQSSDVTAVPSLAVPSQSYTLSGNTASLVSLLRTLHYAGVPSAFDATGASLLSLVLTDTSTPLALNTSLSIQLLFSCQLSLVPVITGVVPDTSFSEVTVSFSSQLSLLSTGTHSLTMCDAFLVSANISALGTGATCTLSSSTITTSSTTLTSPTSTVTSTVPLVVPISLIVIIFGSNPSIIPGSTLQLRNDVFAGCPSFASSSSPSPSPLSFPSIVVVGPVTPMRPVLSLTTQATVGVCSDAVITASATGLGGRPGTYTWFAPSSLLSAFNISGSATSVTIPSYLLVPRTSYTVSCMVSSFLNASSNLVSVKFMKSPIPIPLVTLVVPPTSTSSSSSSSSSSVFTFNSASIVDIESTVSIDPCMQTNHNLVYAWSSIPPLSPQSGGLQFDPTMPARIRTPGTQFVPNIVYQIILTVSVASDPSLSSNATVSIIVVSSPLNAVLSGGSSRVLSAGSGLVLDASPSRDPLRPTLSAAAVFKLPVFTCRDVNGRSCVNPLNQKQSLLAASKQNGFTLTIPPHTLASATTYTFIVQLSSAFDSRTATASQNITLTVGPRLSVSIINTAASHSNQNVIPTTSSFALTTTVTGEVASVTALVYAWQLFNANGATPVEDKRIESDPDFVRTHNNPALILNSVGAQLFAPGFHYLLTVTVTDPLSANSGSASLSFSTLLPPSAGHLSVWPPVGLSSVESFTLTASGWSGLSPPLRFQFFRLSTTTGNVITLSSARCDPVMRVRSLPPGDVNHGYNETLGVRVIDATGADAYTTTTITVLPNNDTAAIINNFFVLYTDAWIGGDVDAVLSLIHSLVLRVRDDLQSSSPSLLLNDVVTLRTSLINALSLASRVTRQDMVLETLAVLFEIDAVIIHYIFTQDLVSLALTVLSSIQRSVDAGLMHGVSMQDVFQLQMLIYARLLYGSGLFSKLSLLNVNDNNHNEHLHDKHANSMQLRASASTSTSITLALSIYASFKSQFAAAATSSSSLLTYPGSQQVLVSDVNSYSAAIQRHSSATLTSDLLVPYSYLNYTLPAILSSFAANTIIDSTTVYINSNPFGPSSLTSTLGLPVTPVFTINLIDSNGNDVPASMLSTSFTVTFVTQCSSSCNSTCALFDTVNNIWSVNGVTSSASSVTSITCTFNQAATVAAFIAAPPPIIPSPSSPSPSLSPSPTPTPSPSSPIASSSSSFTPSPSSSSSASSSTGVGGGVAVSSSAVSSSSSLIIIICVSGFVAVVVIAAVVIFMIRKRSLQSARNDHDMTKLAQSQSAFTQNPLTPNHALEMNRV